MKRCYRPHVLVMLVFSAVFAPQVHADTVSRVWTLPSWPGGQQTFGSVDASGQSAYSTARKALRRGEKPANIARLLLSAGVPSSTVHSALVGAGVDRRAIQGFSPAWSRYGSVRHGFGKPGIHDGRLHDLLLLKLRLIKKILGGVFPGFPPSPH